MIALSFGFTNFVKFAVFGALYYFAALFMHEGWMDVLHSENVFMAIFVMMFGATASGQAQSFGPDLGKAK